MRARALAALSLLLIPAGLTAQRIPFRIGSRRPVPPAELPPTAGPIARELSYKRLNYSVESYPMVAYFSAPGFMGGGLPSHWTSLGGGSHLDYKLTHLASATLDLTSTLLGGPTSTGTAELGMRFHPECAEGDHRAYPYVDFRAGYMSTFDIRTNDQFYGYPSGPIGYGSAYSQGFGGIAGVGMEYVLSRQFSLLSSASVFHGGMTAYNVNGPYVRSHFGMTAYRYTLGLRYNPVRMVRALSNNPRM